MALKIFYKIKHDNVWFKSGNFYSFKYGNYEEDPNPTIIFISGIRGTHPTSGNQWNLIQGINLNYIPRKDRKRFVSEWKKYIENGKSVRFTWGKVVRDYPYLKLSIRRYLLRPVYVIRWLLFV